MRSPQTTASTKLPAAASIFAALGDETRLNIVSRLCAGGPQSIVQLTDGMDVSRQAVTKHLNALEDAGLVRSAREGRERIWEMRTNRLSSARAYLDRISDKWDEALLRLRAAVETDD
jgi:DNA-binding transcriptional ArsR family regulator